MIVPMTGLFAQVGKDTVDGFNIYLDATKSDFASANVKLIVKDD
jgi:branched-chain amino acid transport system substrate-binding protein